MILRVLTLAAFAFPSLAVSQTLPSSFQVKGVAEGDVLNIRIGPSASAEKIGEIGPYGFNIEVLETTPDGTWGKIGVPEGNGWVAMRFLEAVPNTEPHMVPRPLSCLGTEPFWSVSFYPRGAEFNSPDTGAIPMTVLDEGVAPEGFYIRLDEGPTLNRTLIIKRQKCSDGMSDREFGFATMMFTQAPDENSVVAGCCSLDHR